MSAFGIPFFAAGIFLVLAVAGVIPMSNASELPAFAAPLMVLMGLAFTAVGGTLVFGRSWTTIDRAQQAVIKQWGLLIPLRERVTPLHGYQAVRLGFVEGDSDTADRFPVSLKAQSGPDLPVCSLTVFVHARECASSIAQHLQLEFEDATTSNPVRLRPGEVDVPLRERLRHDGLPRREEVRPSGARSEITKEFDQVTILIPSRPLHPVMLVAGVLPIAIPLVAVSPLAAFFRQSNTPRPVGWFFLGFLTLFFGVLPAATIIGAFLRSRRGATLIHASRTGVSILERGVWTTRPRATLDATDILDIDYSSRESIGASARREAEQQVLRSHPSAPTAISPRVDRILTRLARLTRSKGITLKTRTGLTTFGAGLEDEELRWLHSVVLRALTE